MVARMVREILAGIKGFLVAMGRWWMGKTMRTRITLEGGSHSIQLSVLAAAGTKNRGGL